MNSLGSIFKVTSFGESHSAMVGCVVEGVPAGLVLDLEKIQWAVDKRKTNQTNFSSTRNEVQNQNEVKTQNQGEDSQLNVNTQEQESLGENQDTEGNSKEESPRSETAKENMSVVSQKVEELLTTEIAQGGIGEQVKQIAQEQKQAQNQIQTELGKVDTRSGLLKSLIGPNYQALKNMQKQMEQNQLRIQQLERLKNQLTNQGDIVIIQETIQALTDQNTSLQDRIALEERSGSLLGWLFKLFAK